MGFGSRFRVRKSPEVVLRSIKGLRNATVVGVPNSEDIMVSVLLCRFGVKDAVTLAYPNPPIPEVAFNTWTQSSRGTRPMGRIRTAWVATFSSMDGARQASGHPLSLSRIWVSFIQDGSRK